MSLAAQDSFTTVASVASGRAVDLFDISDQLANISIKTLVTHSADNGVHPVDQGRELAVGIHGSELVLLEAAKHALVPQEPACERFFRELQRFATS